MNSLIYNPHITTIEEWNHVYLTEQPINQFQNIIDNTCSSLTSISTQKKIRRLTCSSEKQMNALQHQKIPLLSVPNLRSKIMNDLLSEQEIEKNISDIQQARQTFKSQYKTSLGIPLQREYIGNRIFNQSQQVIQEHRNSSEQILKNKVIVCQNHLAKIKKMALQCYQQFIRKENQLLLTFTKFKLNQLSIKLDNIKHYLQELHNSPNIETTTSQIRILFDNLYIETQYLNILIHNNITSLEEHSYNEHSGDDPELTLIRDKEHQKLKSFANQIEELKQNIRQLYFQQYSQKKSKLILRDPQRLETIIKKQIAVNEDQFVNVSIESAWFNGFICAVLIVALAAIIIFRQVNIDSLESIVDYQMKFQIWRGASYLIIFNWVCAIAFYILSRWKINYRMILLQDDKIIGNSRHFFRSASLLTAIYLVLFLIDLLHRLHYITGHDQIRNMGYYMWLINLVFFFNPLKMFNYNSRLYFLYLLKKMLFSPFNPMNMRIFFITLVVGSFAQPLNDLIFTISSIANQSMSDCKWNSRLWTFVILMVLFSIRIVQSFRLHHQFGRGNCFSKSRMRLIAVLTSIFTIIASFLYALYLTQEMLAFWIATGIMATLARTHSQIRADWGLLSFDKEDCLLRRNKTFGKVAYYVCMLLEPILDVVWVLTISNNVEVFLNISVLYFFMLLGCIELIRRGLWMILRIEEDHSHNVRNLCAMAEDSHIVAEVEQAIKVRKDVEKKKAPIEISQIVLHLKSQSVMPVQQKPQQIPKLSLLIREYREVTFEQIQQLICEKQFYLPKVRQYLSELQKYFNFVRRTYEKLIEEEIL